MPHNHAADNGRTESILFLSLFLNMPANAEGTYEAVFEGHSVNDAVESLASHNFMSVE